MAETSFCFDAPLTRDFRVSEVTNGQYWCRGLGGALWAGCSYACGSDVVAPSVSWASSVLCNNYCDVHQMDEVAFIEQMFPVLR